MPLSTHTRSHHSPLKCTHSPCFSLFLLSLSLPGWYWMLWSLTGNYDSKLGCARVVKVHMVNNTAHIVCCCCFNGRLFEGWLSELCAVWAHFQQRQGRHQRLVLTIMLCTRFAWSWIFVVAAQELFLVEASPSCQMVDLARRKHHCFSPTAHLTRLLRVFGEIVLQLNASVARFNRKLFD